MRQAVEGIIFDLDGTLIDSRQDLADAVNHMLKSLGQGALPVDVISSYVGDGVHNLLEKCLSHSRREDLVQKGVAVFKKHYGKHLLDNTRLYSGVAEMLQRWNDKKKAVVTNKPEGFTRRILEGLSIARSFDPVLGGDSLPVKKPDPEPFLNVLKQWGMAPGKALVVGDSANDIQAGKKAGTLTCAVTYGFRPQDELRNAGAVWVIDSLGELEDCVT